MLERFALWLFGNYSVLIIVIVFITIISILVFYARRLRISEIVVISSLSAVSVASRVLVFIPFFKPCTAIIIISGSAFGPVIGGTVGMLTGLISNVMFGQGPWTPFQMFCWGSIGVIAGFLKIKKKWQAIVFGFFMTLVFYGGIMNFYSMLTGGSVFNIYRYIAFVINGLPCDLIHSAATVIFLYFGWNPFMKRLMRMKTKYGILSGRAGPKKQDCGTRGES